MAAQLKNWMGRGRSAVEFNDKTIPKLSKTATKLVNTSASSKIGLKNSPPYLPSIVAETQHLVQTIFERNTMDMLKENMHIGIFLNNYQTLMAKTLKLFKDAKEFMEDPESDFRRVLNKLTLVFSHSLAELKAFWGGGVFKPDHVIVKHDARDFWDRRLQNRVIVTWDEFVEAFGKVHKFMNPNEPPALKRTIDLLENNYVSKFEFDVFTRLFQPWKQILNNWNVIVCYHPGYQAFMTYDEVDGILRKWEGKPGSYVFRLSCTRLGQWAIGFVSSEGKIIQTIPQSKSLYQALIDGMEEGVYAYPNGEDVNPDIRKQIRVPQEDHIKVSRDQFDLYCNIESTFEACKICDANIKNIRIEPCGHLLCKDCLKHWMDSNGGRETLCPFCREKVISTENVIVDPYIPDTGGPAADPDYEEVPEVAPPLDVPPPLRPRLASSASARSQLMSMSVPREAPPPPTDGRPPIPDRRPSNSAQSRPRLPSRSRAHSSSSQVQPDPSAVHTLKALGFQENQIRKALVVAHNNIEMAANILCQFGAGQDAYDDP